MNGRKVSNIEELKQDKINCMSIELNRLVIHISNFIKTDTLSGVVIVFYLRLEH